MKADRLRPRQVSTIKLLRWVLLLPAAYLAWLVALLLGLLYVSLLDVLCPPELMVSELCTASWHEPALNAGVVAGAAFAAVLVMLSTTLLAPSHRRTTASITFTLGSSVALYMALTTGEWVAGAAAITAGAVVLVLLLKRYAVHC